jgi:hypothetical protein
MAQRLSSMGCQLQPKIDQLSAVASSDHHNGGGPDDLVRSLPSQALSRSAVELVDHGVDLTGVVWARSVFFGASVFVKRLAWSS